MKRSVDDRGNIVDFYEDDEIVAVLDREAEIDGKKDVTTWDGGGKIEEWAKSHGYKEEIEAAIRV